MNGTYGTSNALEKSGPRLIDEFLRRELRVGDPRNAREVVTALRRRYAADAARIDQESAGLPVLYQPQPLALPPGPAAGDTPGTREERRVQADLESDLTALIDSRDNREWAPEIRGWRDTLVREFADGAVAARFAQDPAMRDRAFLAVRRLGEFARVARLVGVMHLALNCDYRRLAASLDDACDVIRILMGEALYNAGLSDGGLIIQVPLVDLRQRRDSLVLAVRRLAGLNEESFDGDWGDDIAAYRALLDEVDRSNGPELKVYLREELLAPILDNLVSTVSRQDPEALRQLAATIPVEIARLKRLREIVTTLRLGTTVETSVAAALTLLEQALQLFIDGFDNARSGARLIDLALPLPLAAHQADEEDAEARRILRELAGLRGDLAREVECFLSCCGCDVGELRCQVKLDKVLFDVDRAIDLFAQGQGRPPDWGLQEQRASIYGIVAGNLSNERGCITPAAAYSLIADVARAGQVLVSGARTLIEAVTPLDTTGQEYAKRFEPWIRLFIASADMLAAGRSVSEGVLRDIQSLPRPSPIASSVATARQRARLNRLASAITDSPVSSAAEAVQLIIDTAELVAGDSNMGDVAGGVVPTANETGGAYTGVGIGATLAALVTLDPSSPLNDAQDAIEAAQTALVASLVAIGTSTQSNLDAAGLAKAAARQAADRALATAFPGPGVTPPPALEQRALTEAADAAGAAADVAETTAKLPVNSESQSLPLFRTLQDIARVLSGDGSPLPSDPAVRGRLMRQVFEDQLRGEHDWLNLIESLAPRCLGAGGRELVLAGRELLYGNPDLRGTKKPVDIAVKSPPAPLRGAVDAISRQIAAAANTLKTAIEGWDDDDDDDDDNGPERRLGRAREIKGRTQKRQRGTSKDTGLSARQSHADRPPMPTPPAAAPSMNSAEGPDRELYAFVKTLQLASASGSRSEIRRAIDMKLLRPDAWESLKTKYADAGTPLKREFVKVVDDLFDVSRKEPIDTVRVHEVLQRVVPFDLGN
jgi:hypothetical protein